MDISQHFETALAAHKIQDDQAQRQAARILDATLKDLIRPKRFFRRKRNVKGVYLYGPVGRGKTMLMDWFFQAAQLHGLKIERWHFHAFMLEIHRDLRDLKQAEMDDRITALATKWAGRISILCFDEFHVTDVADAMIMMPLFTSLFENGVTVIATSNWAPGDLYKNGLQRARFLPFIATLESAMTVVAVAGNQDYRMLKRLSAASWLTPLTAQTKREFDAAFHDAAGYDPVAPAMLAVAGNRSLEIPQASKHAAMLDMAGILAQPLGAGDFIALAKAYDFLFLDNLTPFTIEESDKAKRFMVMIDNLYDGHVSLVVRSAVPSDALYPATGRLSFEFARTLSRLNEMTGHK